MHLPKPIPSSGDYISQTRSLVESDDWPRRRKDILRVLHGVVVIVLFGMVFILPGGITPGKVFLFIFASIMLLMILYAFTQKEAVKPRS